jgi:hypothetical protein
MAEAGHLMAAGPVSEQPDKSARGIFLCRVGSVAEARELAEQDTAVRASVFSSDIMTWLTPRGAISFDPA